MQRKMRYINCSVFLFILLFQSLTPVTAQIKVACIGNSITYGQGLSTAESYPAKLQVLLGSGYEVMNFAVSGTTLLKNNAEPDGNEEQASYWDEQKYVDVLAWKPDIVIIKFGTNDAREANWPSEQGRQFFYSTYVEFINSFKALSSSPKIYICYPLPYFKVQRRSEREQGRVIREEVIPLINKVARKSKVNLIDLHSIFYNRVDLTYDGVHPSDDGTTLMANEIFKALKMNF